MDYKRQNMRRRKENDQEFLERLINKQFDIADCDMRYQTLVDNKEVEDAMPFGEKWYQRFTTTKEKEAEFREFLTAELKKRYKYLRGKTLETQVGLFILMWGLTCPDCIEDLKPEYKLKVVISGFEELKE